MVYPEPGILFGLVGDEFGHIHYMCLMGGFGWESEMRLAVVYWFCCADSLIL